MNRQSNTVDNTVDNTPFWAVDPDRWDLSYMYFSGKSGHVTFDVSKEATVQHLLAAIQQRGNRLYIGFEFYDDKRYFEGDIIQLAQFGGNLVHACVWFGEHVTTLAAGRELGISMIQSPLNFGKWELVSLPFTNVPLALRIGVDIVLKCNKECIIYNDQRWTILRHMMKRLLIPGYQAEANVHSDYDPDKPDTWTHGVHCSQLVLLFLKRCILHNALYTPPQHREKILQTDSYTCLPVDLRKLIREVWGGAGQFRDYRDVGSKVRGVWYEHYWEREAARQL